VPERGRGTPHTALSGFPFLTVGRYEELASMGHQGLIRPGNYEDAPGSGGLVVLHDAAR
jgi:hypothetical protein